MAQNTRHDAWKAGSSYDAYMGRWSREIAPIFLTWLNVQDGLKWVEVGCGTGALSSTIFDKCNPSSLVGIEPSESFIDLARKNVPNPNAQFKVGDGLSIPVEDNSADLVVSALVVNFLPDIHKGLSEMGRVATPGGMVAFYVWDYPGGGMEIMSAFWSSAIALDPGVEDLAEGKRFPFCTPEKLTELVAHAGLKSAEIRPVEVLAEFQNFEEFWYPFTLGAGPAPGYCMSLDEHDRQNLHDHLRSKLHPAKNGRITLNLRAWAIKANKF